MTPSVLYSPRASLVAFGVRFQQQGLWQPVVERVQIHQKVRHHEPLAKVGAALINILAGGHGLNEINTRVRPDLALQRAFGRTTCAEQSSISRTFNACTTENVAQLRDALEALLQQHGQTYVHNDAQQPQLLDIDLTGLPAGGLGEGVTKGYFAHQRNQRGRQLGRVLGSHYGEVLVDQLYPGRQQLDQGLEALVERTTHLLNLDENKRKNTILRMDGGGGSDEHINWILQRDDQLLVKVKNWKRAHKLAASVQTWIPDSKVADRMIGWVWTPHAYVQPTRQVAIRTPNKNGGWHYQVLVFTLCDAWLFALCPYPMPVHYTDVDLLLASVHAYDQRDGGLETQNRNDKQGLGLNRRNKQSFVAQEMMVLLGQFAHNVLIWLRNDLVRVDPVFEHYGLQRIVRDVLQIDGEVYLAADGTPQKVILNPRHPLTAIVQQVLLTDDLSANLRKN
jgi:hypothetical protein